MQPEQWLQVPSERRLESQPSQVSLEGLPTMVFVVKELPFLLLLLLLPVVVVVVTELQMAIL
jgi:hypothetical protein